jgi:radical SAM superfamily enzyme
VVFIDLRINYGEKGEILSEGMAISFSRSVVDNIKTKKATSKFESNCKCKDQQYEILFNVGSKTYQSVIVLLKNYAVNLTIEDIKDVQLSIGGTKIQWPDKKTNLFVSVFF